ncbi:NBS-LRR type resistance protein [Cucumis melo var. makuwa]|uniref:NBS-LRR type resistance protein n=1 Tax=Cucumis melo var. makuwa TaxID=1194695 RepID=A0A5A7V9I5_CUCMM|nr:NBS-LRR type resistance protein [Cucumis melo var. makuwa]
MRIPSPPQMMVLSHSLGTRYARPFWVDDQTTQKVLVGDPSPILAKVVLAVLQPQFLQVREFEGTKVKIEKQQIELEEAKRMIEE